MIFPFYKRVTAIGICNFIGRTITITSSLAAELSKPWPSVIIITITFIQLINVLFLPSKTEEDDYDHKILNEAHQNNKSRFKE